MELRFTIPVPVSANHGNKNAKNHNRRYKTAAAIAFQDEVKSAAAHATSGTDWAPAKDARYAVEYTTYYPDRIRRDIGNGEKLTSDAIKDALKFDDCQIDDIHLKRGPVDKLNPRCEVVLRVLPGD